MDSQRIFNRSPSLRSVFTVSGGTGNGVIGVLLVSGFQSITCVEELAYFFDRSSAFGWDRLISAFKSDKSCSRPGDD